MLSEMDTLSVFSHGVQYYIITNSNIFCTVQIVCKQVKVKDKRIEKDMVLSKLGEETSVIPLTNT